MALQDDLDLLQRLKFELEEQDTLVSENANSLVPASQMSALQLIFLEISDALPDFKMQFNASDRLPNAIRPQLRSARAKVDSRINTLQRSFGSQELEDNAEKLPNNPVSTNNRVFVVHGRNTQAHDAMFTFLHSIGLDPIEWEEAIRMTQQGSPHTSSVIDIAFSNAQAAVILITGGKPNIRVTRGHLEGSGKRQPGCQRSPQKTEYKVR